MSVNYTANGHVLKIRDGNDPERWIEIPVLYQTMYDAYRAFCDINNITAVLSERDYYATLGNLKTIAEQLTGYGGTIPLESGGTGFPASNILELLTYLGLVSDFDGASDEKFPSAKLVENTIEGAKTELKELIATNHTAAKEYADIVVNALDLKKLNILSGSTNPPSDPDIPDGTVYIKYSD